MTPELEAEIRKLVHQLLVEYGLVEGCAEDE